MVGKSVGLGGGMHHSSILDPEITLISCLLDSLKEIASVGINLSSVAPRNGTDRIGMKWGIGSRKNKHLVVEAAGRSKERVAVALTSLSRAVVVLRKGEDLPPMAYGLFIAPQCVEVISSKACNEAAFPSQTSLREIIAAMTSQCAKTLTIISAIIAYAEFTVALLSSEKFALPISFFCPLLQCTIRLKASSSYKNELRKCISAILEPVTAHDLLVLSFTYNEEDLFNLESVRRILSGLVAKEKNVDVFNGGNFKEGYPATMQQVAKTGDAYLGEIASYSDLSTSKEDVVYVSRLRGCGVPLIRKAITHKSHCGRTQAVFWNREIRYGMWKDTQPGLLRVTNGSPKLLALGLQFIPMEQIIEKAVKSLTSKGYIL
ncbi:hypothetical protein Nepgr_000028 [Nepenthes gracilis]|uniref:NPH3 domain-containing protein n=1 Tax=Nepenthes gracilis TaxID=150966 RepID=A0AAD3RVY7_NEPGR|nr:hypothetical protein Nepgr_000028 [Nepenthes gracilis]